MIPPWIWDGYPPELRPGRPPVALGNAGGMSGSALWRVEAPAGPLLLRAWPLGTTADRVDRVHGWLAPLARFPWVAVPLVDRVGATHRAFDARVWELTRFLPGRADLDRPPAPARLAAMFAGLARVHLALGAAASPGTSPGLAARRDELRRLLDREFADLRRPIVAMPAVEAKLLALAWLDRATRGAPDALRRAEALATWRLPLQPVIRDARPDHFLFEGDEPTGLVDFGAMGVDTVAGDLARLLGEAIGRDDEATRSALNAYEAARPLSAEERAAIDAFGAANAVLGGARWVRWHFVEGRRFDDPTAVAAGLRRAVGRLDESGRWDHERPRPGPTVLP